MAIDRTGISSLDAGAGDITYSGNEGPKSPATEQMKMAGMMDQIAADFEIDHGYDMAVANPDFRESYIKEWMKKNFYNKTDIPFAYGGSANPTYTQKRKQQLAGGGVAGLKNRPGYFLGNLVDKIKDDLIPNEIKENPILSTAAAAAALNQWGLPDWMVPDQIASGSKVGQNWIGELLGGRDAVLGKGADKVWDPKIEDMVDRKKLIDLGGIFSGGTKGINPDDKTGGLLQTIGGGIKKGIETIIPGGSPGFLPENLSNALFGTSDIGGQQVNWKTPLAIGMSMGALDKATRKDESLPAQPGIDIANIRSRALTGSDPDLRFLPPASATTAYAQGGRIGYSGGGMDTPDKLYKKAIKAGTFDGTFDEFLDELERQRNKFMAQGGRIGYRYGKNYKSKKEIPEELIALLKGIRGKGQIPAEIRALLEGVKPGKAEGGLMDLGGMEKDYRNEGGFVPIGGQERADDVPARLSKNEFVFTADAVRSAGGGDIDKGAEVMENVMEHLEQGGQISEESQGLEGARNMFATAQRLEGVM